MNISPIPRFASAAAIAGLALMLANPARSDDATQIKRAGTYTTSKGGSGTTSSTTTRSNGTVERKGTWTNASGGTGTVQSQRTWDKSTQTATFGGTKTKPDGTTTSWQGTAVRNAPGSISAKGTITTAGGKQDTFTSSDTRVAPGTWDRQQVITTASGKTIDRTVDTSVAGSKGTRTVTTTLPNGQTVTRNASFSQTVSPAPAATPNN
jgi:hypothetical protein